MRSQHLSTPRIWNTLLPIVQGRAQRKLRDGLQPYQRTSVISQGYLTRWIAHLRTSILRLRCWTCLSCKTANLEAIKRYLEFRLRQFKMLLDAVEDYVEEKY